MQMKKIMRFARIFGKYKYLITIVTGVAIVGLLDENSFFHRWEYDVQIAELKEEIEKYELQYERDSARVSDLKHDVNAITKVARERYMMKADDEDIFILSDDKR